MDEVKERLDNELVEIADGGLRGQGAIVEMMRRLKDAIAHLDDSASKQQDKMLRLTKWIAFLTFVMVAVGIIQFISLFR